MKKFYVLIVVCSCLFTYGFGQDYEWIGGASGNWNEPANWSPSGVPVSSSQNVIFNGSASVTMDRTGNITLNSISVNGSNSDVTITTPSTSDKAITLVSTSNLTPALNISSTATLRLTTTGAHFLYVIMEAGSKGTINGTLSLEGADANFISVFSVQGSVANPSDITISTSGSIIVKKDGNSLDVAVDNFLHFGPESELRFEVNNPIVPQADYDPASEIIFTGITSGNVTMAEKVSVGKITYNCPAQNTTSTLNLPHNITVAGDLTIANTNGRQLILMSNTQTLVGQSHWSITLNDNLNISGNSRVALSHASGSGTGQSFTTIIGGNINAGGLSFSLQNNAGVNLPTTLSVKGNIQHTAGSFTANSTAINQTSDLFIIEMNGTAAQTISSHDGIFDNNNNQITLKVNNAAGVILDTDLAVGRLNFVAGNINNQTHVLGIRNTSGENIVFRGFSSSSYVIGPLERTVATTSPVEFPVGSAGIYRPVTLIPSTASLTTFRTAYFNTGSGDNTVQAPLDGIAETYYWDVSRLSGTAGAEVQLSLPGAIPGAESGDAIVIAKYSGAGPWTTARGTTDQYIIPGTSSTGTLKTEVQTSFSYFTFGYGDLSAVLPINLESFNAKKINTSAQLGWRISENSNPVSFEIMKSTDGINFKKIGTVASFDGKLNYDFTDNSLLSGNNYYRLRMLDKDGKISFSSIVVVMNGTKGVIISSMIPTMVVDRARLNITSSVRGNMQLMVTDISGRVVHIQNASINSGNQEIWLNANRLSSGIFQVTGYINGEKTATIRFFKR